MIQPERILRLVNQARKAYGAFELEGLLPGKPLSASFCPLGRSLRRGMEDWLFVAVGTKHLRVWTRERDPATVALAILGAWELPHQRLKKSADASSFVILPLLPELSEFVGQFDQGLLPDLLGEVDQAEVRQLRELARGIPLPRRQRPNARGSGQSSRQPAEASNQERPPA
jgi:hypothetical protein